MCAHIVKVCVCVCTWYLVRAPTHTHTVEGPLQGSELIRELHPVKIFSDKYEINNKKSTHVGLNWVLMESGENQLVPAGSDLIICVIQYSVLPAGRSSF